MSRCPHSKWGPGSGTPCEKTSNLAATQELEMRLEKMKADRLNLNTIWLEKSTTESSSTSRYTYGEQTHQPVSSSSGTGQRAPSSQQMAK